MVFLLISILQYILDQLSKTLIIKYLPLSESICLVKPILYLTHIHNKGVAFGLFPQGSLFFIWVAAVVIIILLIFSWKIIRGNLPIQIICGLILGGVAGNLTDRLKFGYVIDFIDIRIWPVFNFADMGLTVAVLWLAIIIIIKSNIKNKK